MTIWAVVFVVLMLFWLFFGCYSTWDAANPKGIGTTVIPWCCVAILGYIVLAGVQVAAVVVR